MASRKSILIIISILVLISLAWFTHKLNFDSLINDSPKETSISSISPEKYKKALQTYIDILNKEDPRKAIKKLREDIKTNDPLSRRCHAVVHELGHAGYVKYKNFAEAIKYQDEVCNSGYMHGVIESKFTSGVDIFSEMKTLCSDFPDAKFMSWECNHGMGHGLMYFTENDLPKSIEICQTLASEFAAETCVNGVFMENFNADQELHVSKFLDPANPFSTCRNTENAYKGDCYLYAPTYYLSLHPDKYSEAFKWCEKAEKEYINACIQGVASQAVKENLNNEWLTHNICGRFIKFPKRYSCFVGVVGQYVLGKGSLNEGEKFCQSTNEFDKKLCARALNHYDHLFR